MGGLFEEGWGLTGGKGGISKLSGEKGGMRDGIGGASDKKVIFWGVREMGMNCLIE